MMTISESQFSSNQRSSIHKVNDRVVHQDNFSDSNQTSSVNSALVTNRGFKPSDMYDPRKKEFLTNLSYKLFPEDIHHPPALVGQRDVDLNKIFTPAPDAEENIIKKDRKFEKTFASSAFYVPGVHPTVKQQMELARTISKSLSDCSNHMSRGQSMYVNRKKRSVKWVHEGKGRNTSNTCSTPTPVANHDTPYRPPSSLRQKTYPKSALKNPLPRYDPSPVKDSVPAYGSVPAYDSVPAYGGVPAYDSVPAYAPTRLNDVYAAPRSPRAPAACGPNFNVAPRGWGDMRDYYRPVALDAVGQNLPFTDY